MKTWITTISQKPFAAVNTLWAALHQDHLKGLERLVVFQTEEMRPQVLKYTAWAEILFTEYLGSQPRLKIIDVPDDDFKLFRTQLKKVIREAPAKVLIDMTSGRKAFSAISLVIGELFPGKVEKVYYSLLVDPDYTDFPYPAIPLHITRLYDMMEK